MMWGVYIAVVIVFSGGTRVAAQELVPAELSMRVPGYSTESQAYTYSVKEDGTARVWMRADGVVLPIIGGEYNLTLPEGTTGEVYGWYRENGCPRYENLICIWGGGNVWQEAEVIQEGNKVTVKIPERKIAKQDESVGLSVGLVWGVGEITSKKWWGREVKVVTGKTNNFVSYLSVGVYLPEGVYGRDKQQGPGGWGANLAELSRGGGEVAPAMDAKMAGPSILDSAGSGQIYKYRNNIAPGEDYQFSIMSSTSAWKLYWREIMVAGAWIVAIAVVLSILMYLIVGKKPWWWYVLVTLLIVILFVLIGGLWVTYRFGLSGEGGNYPISIMGKGMGGGVAEPAVEVQY